MSFLLSDGDEVPRPVPVGQLPAEVSQTTVQEAQIGDPPGEFPPLGPDGHAQFFGHLVASAGSAHGRQRCGLLERKVELPKPDQEPQPVSVGVLVLAVAVVRPRSSRSSPCRS